MLNFIQISVITFELTWGGGIYRYRKQAVDYKYGGWWTTLKMIFEFREMKLAISVTLGI